MPLEPTRVDLSRAMLERAFYFALGSYMEQEAKKEDQWRDQTIGQLYDHLSHELLEIRSNMRDQELTYLVHNSVDAVSLATILLAKVMLQAGLFEGDPGGVKRGGARTLIEIAMRIERNPVFWLSGVPGREACNGCGVPIKEVLAKAPHADQCLWLQLHRLLDG